MLEVVPGLVVTQHSGDGKANQYFLRGFNLDHGTDFASYVDGVPVNMPTHAHGQGYADINFLVPELVDTVHYRKGPYFAEEGNFSAAGAARISYVRDSGAPTLGLTVGEDNYYRLFASASPAAGRRHAAAGPRLVQTDGPWTLPEDFQKTSGVIKYSRGAAEAGFSVTGMGYDGSWDSTDQVPQRAVDAGLIPRFGHVDRRPGGESHRYSLSLDAWSRHDGRGWSALAYAIDYHLDLISNFTYALDQVNGDQFEQYDSRRVYGGHFEYDLPASLNGLDGALRAGAELRMDDIAPVALYRTFARERFETIRKDDVRQTQYSAYVVHDQRWTDWLRTEAGLRFDHLDFSVDSDLPGQLRRPDRFDREPETDGRAGTVGRDGGIPECGPRLSHQRRSRHHDPRRPHGRGHAGRTRRSDRAGHRHGDRRPHRGRARPAVDGRLVEPGHRLGVAVRR